MSGFSDDVAIAVTQPLWPARDPRKRSDSMVVFGVAEASATANMSCSSCSMQKRPATTRDKPQLAELYSVTQTGAYHLNILTLQ